MTRSWGFTIGLVAMLACGGEPPGTKATPADPTPADGRTLAEVLGSRDSARDIANRIAADAAKDPAETALAVATEMQQLTARYATELRAHAAARAADDISEAARRQQSMAIHTARLGRLIACAVYVANAENEAFGAALMDSIAQTARRRWEQLTADSNEPPEDTAMLATRVERALVPPRVERTELVKTLVGAVFASHDVETYPMSLARQYRGSHEPDRKAAYEQYNREFDTFALAVESAVGSTLELLR